MPRCWYSQYAMKAPVIRSSHHGNERISSTHSCEMFQSSLTSWSSKIIVDRHRREQPPDVGVGPRLAIQLRVLLEIGDLLTRRISDVSTRTDERGCFRRDVVDVHLVTHQQESIRPLDRSHLQLARIRPQRIDAEAVRMVRRSERVRRPFGRTDPAGSEDQPSLAFSLSGANRRTGPAVDRRPDLSTMQAHLVGIDRSGFEILDQHERVVMPKHLKGVCVVSKHFHDCGRIGLDPDSGRRRSDVAKERAEDEPDVPAWIVERTPSSPSSVSSGRTGGSCHSPTLDTRDVRRTISQ